MKKIFTKILKGILYFMGIVILYLMAVYTIPIISVNNHPNSKPEIPIYILTNGVHTDIVMPVKNEIKDWSQDFPYENTLSKQTDYEYIAIGWGDKGFYLNTPEWKDLKFSTAFKAAFWLSESAIHATYYKNMTEDKECKKIMISQEDYKNLVLYIENSLDKTADHKNILIPTKAVYGKNDAFYEAKGKYNLFYSCNTWANNALKAAHQKAALWTVLDKGIFRHYK